MTDASQLLTHRLRPAAAEPAGMLVLLHGRGVDEHDLFPLLDGLDPERRLVGVTPRAPLRLPGSPGNHWYVVREVGYPDPATFLPTFERLSRFLDALAADSGVTAERIVVGGFSQGCVMSHALTLSPARPRPAGLIALSGFVPEVESFELDFGRVAGLPVAIGHGAYDPVISPAFGERARERYESAGAELTWRESPMAHGVDPGFVAELRPWLERALAAP